MIGAFLFQDGAECRVDITGKILGDCSLELDSDVE
jgi:hypothetical protein